MILKYLYLLSGIKPSDIRLFKNGDRIKPDNKYKLRKDGDLYTLMITSATAADDNADFTVKIGESGVAEGRIRVIIATKTSVEVFVEKSEVVVEEGKELVMQWTVKGRDNVKMP